MTKQKTLDQLRTVSWGNDSHPIGEVKPVYGIPTFPLTAKPLQSKGHIKNVLYRFTEI